MVYLVASVPMQNPTAPGSLRVWKFAVLKLCGLAWLPARPGRDKRCTIWQEGAAQLKY